MENLASESKISINVVLPVYRFGHKHWGPDRQTTQRWRWPWASLDPILGRPPFIDRWITSFVIATLLVAPAAEAFAQSGNHGDGHAQMHDIYQHWHPPHNPGTSCCNNADCRPTRAYVDNDGYWRAWNGASWLLVPQERVLPSDYAGDGRSHLCEKEGFVYCFTPGEIRG